MIRSTARTLILLAGLILLSNGCSSPTSDGPLGEMELEIVLPDSSTIDSVSYHVTGNGVDLSGTVNVAGPGTTVSFMIGGLPPGTNYLLELAAMTSTGATCAGSATFNVIANSTTMVSIVLQCRLPDGDGDVVVGGTVNICPQITSATVAPLTTTVGSSIAVAVTATDADNDPLTYAWTATAGSFAAPAAASTTYLCSVAGTHTIAVKVADGRGCDDTFDVDVTCTSVAGVCGDGTVNPGEQCDDGNTTNGDGCNAQCQTEVCGNGVVDAGEQCDDGNTTAGDGCSAVCRTEVCGNGVVDPAEQCDDGNTTAGDGCSAVCRREVCGNGVVDPGEQCDDGNTTAGDGCSATCQTEANACTTCENQHCRDYFGSDVVTECYNAVGNAAGGPAAGTAKAELCVAFLNCAYTTNCALTSAEECYCGAGVPINTCLTQGGSGLCKAQAERAAESIDPLTIAERFVDPGYAIGNASRLLRCDQEFCASECL